MHLNKNILLITDTLPTSKDDYTGKYILDQLIEVQKINEGFCTVLHVNPYFKNETSFDYIKSFSSNNLTIVLTKILSFPRYKFLRIRSCLFVLQKYLYIKKLIAKKNIEIVHCHNFATIGIGYYIKFFFKIPYLLTIHGREDPTVLENNESKIHAMKTFFSSASRTIIVGYVLSKYLERFNVNNSKLSIISNGINDSWIIDLDQLPPLKERKKELNILSVSGLRKEKGINYSIEAINMFNKFKENTYRLNYKIVGDGPELPALESLVLKYKLENQVKFLGAIANSKVKKELDKCDIFLLPSWLESFGIAHLEAMARGKITIGCYGEGTEAFIDHGKTGFLVKKHDPEDICNIIFRILKNYKELNDIRINALSIITEQFRWRSSAIRLAKVYNEIND